MRGMQLPRPRGPFSEHVFAQLVAAEPTPTLFEATSVDVLSDEDAQIALWALYELSYRGFEDVDPDHEWSPALLTTRAQVERSFEQALRDLTRASVDGAARETEGVAAQVTALIGADEGARLAQFLQRRASREQYQEFLVQRSIYHLKESDPHAFGIPRLDGAAKVALAELQYDEFGAGRLDRLHSTLFARALEGAGLDPAYGAYIDVVPAATLAVNNAMSLFALHRRLRGALMGHLAAFESTSSLPCKRFAGGAERLGYDDRVTGYFDEHVEADAVHEQLAVRGICQRLVEAEPALHDDVLFGVAACLQLEARSGRFMLDAWTEGRSSLLPTDHQEVA
jgi:Iron-containing redox enzyme